MNAASVVLKLKFNDSHFIFGADSTKLQWMEHKRQLTRLGVKCLNASFLKAPHHGSKHNNSLELYNYLLNKDSEKNLFISANGKSHPDDEIFDLINEMKLNPYCTSLANQCLPRDIYDITAISRIRKEFRAFLTSYEVDNTPTPCQGDITIEFNDNSVKIYNSTGNLCPYRETDVDFKKLI